MSSQYSAINLVDVIPDTSGCAAIVNTTDGFVSATRLHALLSVRGSIPYDKDTGITALSNAISNSVAANAAFEKSYAAADTHVLATNNLRRYFDSPAKLIQCTEPTQLLLAVRCVCDGILQTVLACAGISSSSTAKVELAQRAADAVHAQVPFDDGESLESHMAHVANYLWSVYAPESSIHASEWRSEAFRCAVYAAYYPFFVFVYILSFVDLPPTPGAPAKRARSNIAFLDSRRAKLCCYLFVTRMVVCLHDRMPDRESLGCTDDCKVKAGFLVQIADNLAFNVLNKEYYNVEVAQPVYQEAVRQLSATNQMMSSELVQDNQKYDMYKQNLTAAANSEASMQRQLASARASYSFHFWLWVVLLVACAALLALPDGTLPRGWDGKLVYGASALAALYVLIVALIGAVRAV